MQWSLASPAQIKYEGHVKNSTDLFSLSARQNSSMAKLLVAIEKALLS